ncbi:MAG: SUMF1/EgtB/PvdO family nonheme iron enzyme [Bacteroidales bacterium]
MLRIVCILMSVMVFASCGFLKLNDKPERKYELVGQRKSKQWFETLPYGMTFVPRGSYKMGQNDEEPLFQMRGLKQVTIDAFWIDETEITNAEYKQFIEYVKDKTAREVLSKSFPEFMITEDEKGNPIDPPKVNFDIKIDFSDPEIMQALEPMCYDVYDRLSIHDMEIDNRALKYTHYWIDYRQAAKVSNTYDYKTKTYSGSFVNADGETVSVSGRKDFVRKEDAYIYPDTLCWVRDYEYSYNEPLTRNYFSHPGFDEYPVVGITWKQAKSFCHWRTQYMNDYLESKGQGQAFNYRLPTEAEWEYAARGGLEGSIYPWGAYYAKNCDGCLLANFKPMRGNYIDDTDQGATTVSVASYNPNGYGIYDMAGNVAEWTEDAYSEVSTAFINDFNPSLTYDAKPGDPPAMRRKVVRGGSWKDPKDFIRVYTRDYEYQDTTRAYIGFRCLRSSLRDELIRD